MVDGGPARVAGVQARDELRGATPLLRRGERERAMNEKRLCLFCRHFSIDFGSQGYSEYTPGGPGSLECHRERWKRDATRVSEKEFAELMLFAQQCPDWEFYKDA